MAIYAKISLVSLFLIGSAMCADARMMESDERNVNLEDARGYPGSAYGGYPGSAYGGYPGSSYGGYPGSGYGGYSGSPYGGYGSQYGGYPGYSPYAPPYAHYESSGSSESSTEECEPCKDCESCKDCENCKELHSDIHKFIQYHESYETQYCTPLGSLTDGDITCDLDGSPVDLLVFLEEHINHRFLEIDLSNVGVYLDKEMMVHLGAGKTASPIQLLVESEYLISVYPACCVKPRAELLSVKASTSGFELLTSPTLMFGCKANLGWVVLSGGPLSFEPESVCCLAPTRPSYNH